VFDGINRNGLRSKLTYVVPAFSTPPPSPRLCIDSTSGDLHTEFEQTSMKQTFLITVSVFLLLTSWANSMALIPHSQTEPSIPSIRQRYASINKGIRKYRRVKKELSGYSLEGGELVAYFNGPRIVKMTAVYFGESGKAAEEYYYWNEKLFLVFRREYTYDQPMSGKIVNTQANRFYFSNDRLIRWIDENGKTKPSGAGDYQEKQQELLDTSKNFLKAARSPEPMIEARKISH
jgi:Trm5-related predicted tRNA methylase